MLSTETTELMRFTDEAGTIQGALSIGNDGTIRVYRNSVTSGTLAGDIHQCAADPDLELYRGEAHGRG
jgi:hypothetical protein